MLPCHTRASTPEDVPALRALWAEAFGDGGDYLDNFFSTSYCPENFFLTVRGGEVLSMAAILDTELCLPQGERLRCGYLYAVATAQSARGQGHSSSLLGSIAETLRARGYALISTVPAEPSLHRFFGGNGFREGFVHAERTLAPEEGTAAPDFPLTPLSPEEYGRQREALLTGCAHIAFPARLLRLQDGCGRLSGGGLFAADTAEGRALLCTEGGADGKLLVKELLGPSPARARLLQSLRALLPQASGTYRVPEGGDRFGMLQWLRSPLPLPDGAYLGFAFD